MANSAWQYGDKVITDGGRVGTVIRYMGFGWYSVEYGTYGSVPTEASRLRSYSGTCIPGQYDKRYNPDDNR